MATPRFMLALSFMFSVTLLLLGTAAPSGATLTCGDTIGPNEVVILTHDLSCPGGGDPAVTVESGAILNLFNHTIDCVDKDRIGIRVVGSGSIVQYGIVRRCSVAVQIDGVAGEGGHIVTKITADANRTGFLVNSSDNELQYTKTLNTGQFPYIVLGARNTLLGNLLENEPRGFNVSGEDHTLSKNQAISSGGNGFSIDGQRFRLSENLAKGNATDGFTLEGEDHVILENTASHNGSHGFIIESDASGLTLAGNRAIKNKISGIEVDEDGLNNTIVGNFARRNQNDDLVDLNVNCDNNQWVGNIFQTSNQGCIQ